MHYLTMIIIFALSAFVCDLSASNKTRSNHNNMHVNAKVNATSSKPDHQANKKTKSKTDKSSAASKIHATGAILIDFDTGAVLFEKQADAPCHPSSMTKLMTLYVLFSHLANSDIDLKTEYEVSDLAQSMKGSRSFFKAGTNVTVLDLILSIVVHSGNDACITIAEGLSGCVEIFVKEMNQLAQKMQLSNTVFMNPTGMPEEGHMSSVKDIATIAIRIIKDFPQYYQYFSEISFTINGITQKNRNTLLGKYPGVDGLKTGRTDAGGYGIVVSAKQNDKRLVVVVNGCKNDKERSADAKKLLSFGFNEYASYSIATANKPIVEVNVWLGEKEYVSLSTKEDIVISIPKKMKKSLIVEARMKEPINAPIKAGDKVGTLVYKYGDFVSKEHPLYACESVEKLSFFNRAGAAIKYLLFKSSRPTSINNYTDSSCAPENKPKLEEKHEKR